MASNPAKVGIETYHEKHCLTRAGGRCNCTPSYRGVVYDRRSKKAEKGPRTKVLAEARGWRVDAQRRIRRGGPSIHGGPTLAEAAEQWLAQAKSGAIRARGGQRYKPSTLRNYESSLHEHVLPVLGVMRLARLTRRDVQDFVDRMILQRDGSTVCNAVVPLRVICRYALTRQRIEVNPCAGLELPSRGPGRFRAATGEGRREQIATAEEAATLIAALDDVQDQAIWAAAFYAGLRRGELRALYRRDLDFQAGVIRVQRGWDACEGFIPTKTSSSVREVPIVDPLAAVLGSYLPTHDGREFAFPGYGRWGRDYGPFSPDALLRRSTRQWRARGLEPIGLHEARHTYASLMIASGIPIAMVSRLMGHASVSETEKTYFHLLPRNHAATRAVINTYLSSPKTA